MAVTKYFLSLDMPRSISLLDFGCGKFASQLDYFRDAGYDVKGYDTKYSGTIPLGSQEFDVILVSNVINTLQTEESLKAALNSIKTFAGLHTQVIVNYPQSRENPFAGPRKLGWLNAEMRQYLESQGFVIDRAEKYSTGDEDTKAGVIWIGHF